MLHDARALEGAPVERCPCCDQPMPEDMRQRQADRQVERHGLMVCEKTAAVYWHGEARPGTSPMGRRLLTLLLQRAEVNIETLLMVAGERCSLESLHVHIHHLRKWLATAALPLAIVSIGSARDHWGYRIVKTETD